MVYYYCHIIYQNLPKTNNYPTHMIGNRRMRESEREAWGGIWEDEWRHEGCVRIIKQHL